jgi:hypothetical protein
VAAAEDVAEGVGAAEVHRDGADHRELERWGNAFTALVLTIIGALVLAGVI